MNKVLLMIGLAKRAGRVISGAELCEKEIRKKRAELIIIASDISANGRKAITDLCAHYSVNFIEYSTMNELGNTVGAGGARSVISINDKGFAEAVLKKYTDLQTGRNGE